MEQAARESFTPDTAGMHVPSRAIERRGVVSSWAWYAAIRPGGGARRLTRTQTDGRLTGRRRAAAHAYRRRRSSCERALASNPIEMSDWGLPCLRSRGWAGVCGELCATGSGLSMSSAGLSAPKLLSLAAICAALRRSAPLSPAMRCPVVGHALRPQPSAMGPQPISTSTSPRRYGSCAALSA